MKVLERFLGNPWVFENVRPLVVGGIDMSPAYRQLRCDQTSSILDIGCGTGDALRYLEGFSSYLGVDTDARAIRFAEQRWGGRAAGRQSPVRTSIRPDRAASRSASKSRSF